MENFDNSTGQFPPILDKLKDSNNNYNCNDDDCKEKNFNLNSIESLDEKLKTLDKFYRSKIKLKDQQIEFYENQIYQYQKGFTGNHVKFVNKIIENWKYLELLIHSSTSLTNNILKFYKDLFTEEDQILDLDSNNLSIDNFLDDDSMYEKKLQLTEKIKNIEKESKMQNLLDKKGPRKEYSDLILKMIQKCIANFKQKIKDRKKIIEQIENLYLYKN